MTVFVYLLLSFSSSFCYETKLSNSIEDFLNINYKLNEYNIKSDNNDSIFSDEKKQLKSAKQDILASLPSLIAMQKDENISSEIKTQKDLLLSQENKDISASSKVLLELKLASLNLDYNFYETVFALKKLFLQNASYKEMKDLLERAILSNNVDLSIYKDLQANLNFDVDKQSKYLNNKINSYDEILSFLRDNAHSFENNLLFSSLKLDSIISYINSFFSFSYVNIGKIVLCVLVLIFFDVLKHILPNAIYFILLQIFFKNKLINKEKQAELKEIFVNKNKKIVRLILFVYSLGICVNIVYYPAPINLDLSSVFYITYIVLFTWLTLGLLDSYGIILLAKLAKKSGKKEVANLIIKILYFFIIIVATLFILAKLGFNVSAIIASLGIGGLAVALAAKDIIANFFSSLILSFDDSFNQGDWVKIADVEGTIVETGLRKTSIRTFDNSLVFLPNSVILNSNIRNYSKRKMGRQVKISLGLTYDSSSKQLEDCANDLRAYLRNSPLVAQRDDSAIKYGDYRSKYRQNFVSIDDLEGYKNSFYVYLSEFKDSSINIELDFYIKAVDKESFVKAREKIMLDIMAIVEKNKLNFAFPSLSLYMEKQS